MESVCFAFYMIFLPQNAVFFNFKAYLIETAKERLLIIRFIFVSFMI